MIKRVFLFLLILFVALIIALLVFASSQRATDYFAEKFLKGNGVEYKEVKGSIYSGFTLYGVNYTDAISAKSITINYSLLTLLSITPKFTKLEAVKLLVTPKNFAKSSDENSSEFMMIPFALSQLSLIDTKIIFDDETLAFDMNASDIRYVKSLDVKRFTLDLKSSYGDLKAEGRVVSDHLFAKSVAKPQKSLLDKYVSFLSGLGESYDLEIDATLQRVAIKTHFKKLTLSAEQNLSVQNSDVNISYFFEEKHFNLDASYLLFFDEFSMKVKQNVFFNTSLNYTSDLNATQIKSPFELPFKALSAKLEGNSENMRSHLKAGSLEFELRTEEYKRFVIHAKSEGLSLSFLSSLPEALKKNIIALEADATLEVSPYSVKGRFESEGLYSSMDGSFKIDSGSKQLLVALHPKAEADIWDWFPIKKFSPLHLTYYESNETNVVNLDADKLNLTIFRDGMSLSGFGNLGSANFNASGIMDDKDANITFIAHVPSADELLSEFMPKAKEDNSFFDAEFDINSTFNFSQKIFVKSKINMPWFIVKSDTISSYKGENLYVESILKDNKLTLERYSFNIMNHNFYSKRASKISFDTNATMNFEEFWIYDNLLLTGLINTKEMNGKLHMRSDGFKYETKDGYVTLRADVKADFESNGTQNIEGSVTLLDGTITYEPSSDYTISDDIIIIQDMKPPSSVKRYINLYISSEKLISYKSKEVDVKIVPELVLWQDLETPLTVYGMLTIQEGSVKGGGKVFEFDKIEIYFSGANPVNPYLNLNLHYYTLDYVDVEIFISNKLSSPVVILSSSPQMSQNEIMSYILFGERATTVFENSGRSSTSNQAASSLFLATGLKEIFNDTAGINIDTLNILTNEEGTLGYEVGTRLSKQVRLIYKNDTVSSVILQYSLSKSVRIDVNVNETGQGVSIIYIKDF